MMNEQCLNCYKPCSIEENKPPRQKILEEALNLTCGDRAKTYGRPKPNLNCFALLMNAYVAGKPEGSGDFDATDAAIFMALAKISRIAVNKKHKDNYIDGAAYLAIAREVLEDD